MKILIVTFCLIYIVSAVPVPEEKAKSIELLKIPLKGDKVCMRMLIHALHPCTGLVLD